MKIDIGAIDRKTLIKWVFIVIVIIALYFGIRKVIKTINQDKDQKDLSKEINVTALSYPLNQYLSLADQIDGSFTYLTTDENAIYNVFKKMNTLSDVLQLNKSFGVRKFYGFFGDASLAVFLQKGMKPAEIANINKILKVNNINFSF